MNAASIVVVGIIVVFAALAVVRNLKRRGGCSCGCGGCGGVCGGACAERHAGHDHAAVPGDGNVEAKNAN